jgi:hypothetical protein
MAGLVAIVSRDAIAPVTDSDIAEFARTYESVRGVGTKQAADAGDTARVTLICSAGGLAGFERAGSSWAAFVGRPYCDGPLARARLEDVDGQFALVSYDAEKREINLASDPFAMQTLFIADRGPFTYASTSALALAKFLRAPPDQFGLEVFLRAGYHFGALTNWQGIERLEPATRISIGPGGVSRTVYWRPEVDRSVTRMEFAGAVAHCSEVAVATFRRFLGDSEPRWLDLTGGFDTRLLALLLDAGGIDFICDTRGDVDDDDRRIAREIAAVKGWELFDPTMPENWHELLPELLPLAVAWGDGNLQALELAWVLWVHFRMGERKRGLLSAGGGEHWRGFAWSQEFLRAGRSTRVNMDNWIDMRLLHPMNTAVFARDNTDEIREDFRRRMLAWASPYSEELNTVQLDVMYAYKMTGHFGAYRSSDDACLSAELPFYLKPSFTAAISADYRHRSNHRLMRHAIWGLDATVASIRTASGGPAMPWRPGAVHRFVPYYTRIGRRAVTKLAQTSIGRPLLAPPEPGWWAPRAARAAAVELLGVSRKIRRREMRSLALYDGKALEEFLESALADPVRDAELLGRIITVELALRHEDATLDAH